MTTPRPKSTTSQRRSASATPVFMREIDSKPALGMKDLVLTQNAGGVLPTTGSTHHYSVTKIVKKLTSTGADSPFESKPMTPLALSLGLSPRPPQINQVRDVSYLTDRQHHGYLPSARGRGPNERAVNIPPSRVPKDYYVTEICTDPQSNPGAVWDDDSKMWKQVAFPSLVPSGRSEVVLLEECYDKMLSDWEKKTKEKNHDTRNLTLDDFDAAKKIYLICFVEIVRQISVHCVERGRLLTRLWNAFVGMNDHQLQYIVSLMDKLRGQLGELHAEYSKVCQECEDMKRSHAKEMEKMEEMLEESRELQRSLESKIEELNSINRENNGYKEESARLRDALQRYQELLERLHDYTNIIKESAAEHGYQLPTMSSSDSSLNMESNSGIYSRFGTYLKDLEYLKGFSKNLKQKYEVEIAAKVERQNHWEQVNQALLDELARLRRTHTEAREFDTANAGTQTGPIVDDMNQEPDLEIEDISETKTESAKENKTVAKESTLLSWTNIITSKLITKVHKGTGSIVGTKVLLKLISNIYQEKMNADDVDDRLHHPRQPMPEFIYDFFINKYGLRQLAEGHLANMLATLMQYKGDNIRIQMFSKFCDAVPKDKRYPKFAIDFYLQIYRQLFYSTIGVTYGETDDGVIWTPLQRAITIFNGISLHLDADKYQIFLQKINAMAVDVNEELMTLAMVKSRKAGESEESISLRPSRKRVPTEKLVDLDKFVLFCIDEWINESNRTLTYLEGMFHAADISGDGLLQPDEFHGLIQYVDPFCNERQIARIFSDALKNSDTGIDLETFIQVAKEYNFGFNVQASQANSDKVFTILTRNWASSESAVETAIKYCRDYDRGDDADRIAVRKDQFLKLLREKSSPQAAWIAYKMLMIDASNIKRYNAPERNQIVVGSAPTPPPDDTPNTNLLRPGIARRKSVQMLKTQSSSKFDKWKPKPPE